MIHHRTTKAGSWPWPWLAVWAVSLVLSAGDVVQAQARKGGHAAQKSNPPGKPPASAKKPAPEPTQTIKAEGGAAPKAESRPGSKTAAEVPIPSDQEVHSRLLQARDLLNHRGGEHQGRRTRARQEVERALALLSYDGEVLPAEILAKGTADPGREKPNEARKPGDPTAPARGAQKGSGKRQPDLSLEQARDILQDLESRMSANGVSRHEFIQTRDTLREALRELNLALVEI